MQFRFHITMNEKDYSNFNHFCAVESTRGKKRIRRTQIFCGLFVILIVSVSTASTGWDKESVIYLLSLMPILAVYLLLLKKIIGWISRKQVSWMKKDGKLPFDPDVTFEFYDDRMVEITPASRTERSYDSLERICIVGERYIILFNSSVSGYVLPVQQIEEQGSKEEFLEFLSQKCKKLEYYK